MNHRFSLLAAVAVTSLALVGCAATPSSAPASTPPSSVAADAQFNDQDVTFLSDMIPHHAQALLMVDMTDGRELTPAFADLTQGIEAAQGPEIDQMSDWLGSWGYDVPDTASHMGMMGSDNGMGMMTDEDTETLGGMMGGDFEAMWLRMMIKHHEGAVSMSQTELKDGVNPEARDLAQRIVDAQEAEIALMEQLLAAGS